MSEGLNRVTEKMEKLGLVILKDENGKYVARGNRNIKINGENIKPLLASAVEALPNVTILNRVAITDYLVKENQIYGAVGFSIENETAVEIRAKKVLCATGGASGLYRYRTIRDSPDIRCGIRHLIPEPVMPWELSREQR